MAAMIESRVLEVLALEGRSVADWLLVEDVPLVWDAVWGPLVCLVEEDGLAEAFIGHLKTSGARQFPSLNELLSTAQQERWPGWERATPP
jgi:hypothetical protein